MARGGGCKSSHDSSKQAPARPDLISSPYLLFSRHIRPVHGKQNRLCKRAVRFELRKLVIDGVDNISQSDAAPVTAIALLLVQCERTNSKSGSRSETRAVQSQILVRTVVLVPCRSNQLQNPPSPPCPPCFSRPPEASPQTFRPALAPWRRTEH